MNKRNIVFTLVVVLFLALPGVAVSSHPPDPTDWDADFGAALLQDDDDSDTPALGAPVSFYGTAYGTVHINSNGNVTFDTPETAYDGLAGLFSSHLMAAPGMSSGNNFPMVLSS